MKLTLHCCMDRSVCLQCSLPIKDRVLLKNLPLSTRHPNIFALFHEWQESEMTTTDAQLSPTMLQGGFGLSGVSHRPFVCARPGRKFQACQAALFLSAKHLRVQILPDGSTVPGFRIFFFGAARVLDEVIQNC